MLLLVTKSHPTIAKLHAAHPGVGRLVVPRDCARVGETHAAGIPWACDNAAFSGFDPRDFLRMLDAVEGVPGCRFVVAPDIVGDWIETQHRLYNWAGVIRERGLPVALALQDGLTVDRVPWAIIDAVFVGGSTEYKMGDQAREIVAAAKRGGLWAHMGRVNTVGRIRYANAIGCDSVDGSKWSRWTDTYIRQGSDNVTAPAQGMLA